MRSGLSIALGVLLGVGISSLHAQTSYFNQGFLRQPDAASDRAYLGVGSVSGTVLSFSSGNLNPLFTTSVATPNTTPVLSYTLSSQNANTVFAGPPGGGPATPTFRALTTADIPTLSGYVLSITNASLGLGTSLIDVFTAPVPSIKTLSAGAGVTLTDNGGTNITISSASAAAGTDISMNSLTAYDSATNFAVDLSFAASTLVATGAIYFNYTTNWGLASTSRVCNVYIPATNLFRPVYFINAATNWHLGMRSLSGIPTGYGAKLSFQMFGPGETNVSLIPSIDATLATSNTVASLNPSSITNLQLWLDAAVGVYHDEQTNFLALDGVEVRGWRDLSGKVGKLTNNVSSVVNTFYHNPNTAPGNVPCIQFTPGTSSTAWLQSPSFAAITQPIWVFIMFYDRGGPIIFDGVGVNNRIACAPVENAVNNITLFAGANLNVPASPKRAWELFVFEGNNTSSVIRTNGVQAISGSAGNNTVVGFEVGSDSSITSTTGSYNANGYIAEILVYTNMAQVNVTNVENYFRAKYGAW